MNLRELSELVQVTVHLKDVINSAGYTKFKPETITSLKKRLSEFDELFVSEMLNYDTRDSAKMIQDAVREAREKMDLDQKYPNNAHLKADEERKAREEAMAAQEKHENALAKLEAAAAKAVPASGGKKPFVRRNAKPVEEAPAVAEDLRVYKTVEELQAVEPAAVVKEKEVKEQPKKASAPSSNQPYMEDQSLAALLAAERQKVAGKKRK